MRNLAAAAAISTPPSPHLAPARNADRRHISGSITAAMPSLLPPPSQASGAAGCNDPFFPMDVVREILLRVPSAKTLCRLRAVCRSWRYLLSTEPFVSDHAARHPDPLFDVSLVPRCSPRIPISKLYPVSDPRYWSPGAEIRFLDASGDVVKRVSTALWCPSQITAHGDLVCLVESSRRVRLLDPVTGATTLLPENKFPSTYLLGRTGAGDGKLKVLSIATYRRHICNVLTLGGDDGGVWRRALQPPTAVHTDRQLSAVVNGVAYFRSNTWDYENDSEDDENDTGDNEDPVYNQEDFGHDEDGRIAAFDLKREQWWPRLLPGPPVEYTDLWSYLVELSGRLVAVADKEYSVELWFLASSGDGGERVLWCKQCTIQLSRAKKGLPRLLPLWVLDEGRVAFWAYKRGGHDVLQVYNPAMETCTDVATMEDCTEVEICVYTGSLLRIPGAH